MQRCSGGVDPHRGVEVGDAGDHRHQPGAGRERVDVVLLRTTGRARARRAAATSARTASARLRPGCVVALRVQHPAARAHPLHQAGVDDAGVAVRVLVDQAALEHPGDDLGVAVRVGVVAAARRRRRRRCARRARRARRCRGRSGRRTRTSAATTSPSVLVLNRSAARRTSITPAILAQRVAAEVRPPARGAAGRTRSDSTVVDEPAVLGDVLGPVRGREQGGRRRRRCSAVNRARDAAPAETPAPGPKRPGAAAQLVGDRDDRLRRRCRSTSTVNSSPPTRATSAPVSTLNADCRSRPTAWISWSPATWPRRVVDELEPVDVDGHRRDGAASCPGATANASSACSSSARRLSRPVSGSR